MSISTIKLAKYLAREAMYRGFRKSSPTPFGPGAFTRRRGKGKEVVKVSVLRSNILGGIFYTLISLFSSASLFIIPNGLVSRAYVFSLLLTILMGFALAMALMQVTSFTSTFIRERIIDLIRLLPLSDREVLKVYSASLTLYSGGLSVSFLFIPFLAVSAYLSLKGLLPAAYIIVGAVSAACLMIFSYSLGIALGSYSYLVSKKASLRAVSTVAWLACFLMMYLMYGFTSRIASAATYVAPYLKVWGVFIPFIGPLYSLGSQHVLAFSIIETFAVTAASYSLAVRKVKSLITGAEYALAAKAVAKPVKPAEVRVTGVLKSLIKKDLKLLSRDSRRLANMLFMCIFPIIFAFTFENTQAGALGMYLSFIVAGFVGSISGTASDVPYYVEGSGALVMYTLPVSKRDVALSKAISTSIVTLPIASVISGVIAFMATHNPLITALSVCITVALNIGYSMLNSSLNVRMLPKEPSEWTEYSLRVTLGRGLAKGLTRILLVLAGVGIPSILLIAVLAGLVSQDLVIPIMIAFAAASLGAGVGSMMRIKRDEDLTM